MLVEQGSAGSARSKATVRGIGIGCPVMTRELLFGGAGDEPLIIRITAQHFCATMQLGGRCPPIIGHMGGWPLDRIRDYCANKGWTLELIKPTEDS